MTSDKTIEELYQELLENQAVLSRTDWCVVKCAELGLSVQVTYPNEFAQREQARKAINDIEIEITKIKDKKDYETVAVEI